MSGVHQGIASERMNVTDLYLDNGDKVLTCRTLKKLLVTEGHYGGQKTDCT